MVIVLLLPTFSIFLKNKAPSFHYLNVTFK
nr:MAG TPA: hypothetical protein [Caudoviricetes sp.]